MNTLSQRRNGPHIREFTAALLLLQPLLDVLSYFMIKLEATVFTTALRTVLLFTVSLYAFAVSEKKRWHLALYGILGGFWLVHMLSCFRTGYQDPMGDAAEYLKLIQFPLWTLAFLTLFHRKAELSGAVIGYLAADLALILLVILLSFGTGNPVYTYDYPERGMQIGVLGWFGVPNAQSAVVAALVSPFLLWGIQKKRLWLFSLCCLIGFGLLYLTGTRLTYFAAFLIAAGFLFLLLWNKEPLRYCLPLLAVLILLFALKSVSPMQARQARSEDSNTLYQEKTDEILGKDWDFVYKKGEEIPEETLRKLESLYTEVYGVPGPYGLPLLGDMIERFGLDRVMEAYQYTASPRELYNARLRKLTALRLLWQEQDPLAKLVGFEYASCELGGNIYDPENDFQPLIYYYGFLGAALYLALPAGLVLWAVFCFFRDPRRFLSLPFGTAVMMFALCLGAAQFSGQALRKPSVCVYLSLSAALIFEHCEKCRDGKSRREARPPVYHPPDAAY